MREKWGRVRQKKRDRQNERDRMKEKNGKQERGSLTHSVHVLMKHNNQFYDDPFIMLACSLSKHAISCRNNPVT